MLHKVEKALMLETDVSETPNEMIFLAKKFGRDRSSSGSIQDTPTTLTLEH